MRIYFESMTLPKKAAKRVKAYFSPEDGFLPSMKLSEAQEITAFLLGYETWHELYEITKSDEHEASLLDEDCSTDVQIKRVNFQNKRLACFSPLTKDARRKTALSLRVSSKNPKSAKLTEQIYCRSLLIKSEDFDAKENEWRFFCLTASIKDSEKIDYFEENAAKEKIKIYDAFKRLCTWFKDDKDNILVLEELLRWVVKYDLEVLVSNLCNDFENSINRCIPDNFPKKRVVYMPWGYIDNRVFHRTVCWYAETLYRLQEHKKAKRWFNFSYRTCHTLRDRNLDYRLDLKRYQPRYNVHKTE